MDLTPAFPFPIPHSCYPNCGLNGANQVITLRRLEEGERQTIDYSTLFTGTGVVLNCSCGHVGCRKTIRGFTFLPVVMQDFYLEQKAVSREVLISLHLNSNQCIL